MQPRRCSLYLVRVIELPLSSLPSPTSVTLPLWERTVKLVDVPATPFHRQWWMEHSPAWASVTLSILGRLSHATLHISEQDPAFHHSRRPFYMQITFENPMYLPKSAAVVTIHTTGT